MFKTIVLVLVSIAVSVRASASDLIFFETFDGAEDVFESGKWVKSNNARYTDQPILIKPPTKTVAGFENDKGLQLTQEMKHYGFGAKFAKPLTTTHDELVVQYEVKMEELLECGGAYIKLLRELDAELESLSNATPYSIMFGPDKCGSDSKVHFILQHQNPVTKEWTEHHFNELVKPKIDRGYHLYSLQIRKDNSFDIYIDTKPVAKGNLLTDLKPPINPTKEIDDPTDFKPSNWVEEALISDPTAVKPVDWDETQPKKLPNPKAKKPSSWDESLPTTIPDPEVSKPDDWDDEEDGPWEAPVVSNPACEKAGCGPWTPPMVSNPLYKGKWKAPKIPNPDYKGVWAAKKIPNEGYFQEANPYSAIAPAHALAVEVWTTTAGILFDNFHIGHSYHAAHAYARSTTAAKAKVEREALKAAEKEQARLHREETLLYGSLVDQVTIRAEMAAEYLKENPMIMIHAAIVVVLATIYFLIFGDNGKLVKTRPAATAKKARVERKEEEVKAAEKEVQLQQTEPTEGEEEEEESTAALESKDID